MKVTSDDAMAIERGGRRWYLMSVRAKIAARTHLAGAAAYDVLQGHIRDGRVPEDLSHARSLTVWEVMQTVLVNSRVSLEDAGLMCDAFAKLTVRQRDVLARRAALADHTIEDMEVLASVIEALDEMPRVGLAKATKVLALKYSAAFPMLDSAVRLMSPGSDALAYLQWFSRLVRANPWLANVGSVSAVAAAEKAIWFDASFPWAGTSTSTSTDDALAALGWRLVYWKPIGRTAGSATHRNQPEQFDGCVWRLSDPPTAPTVRLEDLPSDVRGEIVARRDALDRGGVIL